jgi:hypothetical protein
MAKMRRETIAREPAKNPTIFAMARIYPACPAILPRSGAMIKGWT